jgi:hypothetical protein
MEIRNELVEIYSGELWQSSVIKDLLEDNGIHAFIENEVMGNIAPWQISSGGVASVKIKILSSDYALAIELVDEFNNSSYSSEEEDE